MEDGKPELADYIIKSYEDLKLYNTVKKDMHKTLLGTEHHSIDAVATVKKKQEHYDRFHIYVVPQRFWGDRSDTDHSKCLLLGGRRLNLLTIIPKPKGSGGARAATAQIGPANERNKTK